MSNTQEYLVDVANLVTLPDIYLSVKETVDDPATGMMELADLLSNDPAIASRLLKVANSPIYGQMVEVDTIKKAVILLGTKTVHDVVLAISVASSFQSIVGINYDVETFWRNSLMRAAVAKSCAEALDIGEADRLFILGLLSDIGHMVMSIRSPNLMKMVLLQHQKTGHPLYLFERSTFGFDYSELSAELLDSWSIPHSIVSGIRYQNCPEMAPAYRQEAAILYCAGRLRPDEDNFPNLVDIETLRKSSFGDVDFDAIRENATIVYEEANTLLPITRLKQAI